MARGDPGRNGRRSSTTNTTTTEPQPAWVTAMLDQFAAARGQFDPHNAKAVVALMDHFPTVLEGMAEFATAIGRQSVDAVDLPPAAQETFLALGKFQRQAVGPVRDALTAARDTVRDRIARYQEGRSQDEAWDVSKNRD